MTPSEFTRIKYQLQLGVENAKANGLSELRVDGKILKALVRQYAAHFSIDHEGSAWLNGVKLVAK